MARKGTVLGEKSKFWGLMKCEGDGPEYGVVLNTG